MYAQAHANAAVRSVPDAATDQILDGAFAGWDARIYVPEPGVDPFEGINDEALLHGHAGIIAATVMAQANQMRILDSAIVPDRDLVRPTADASNKFNEFDVYTPTTPAERYAVLTAAGEEEVIVPSEKFYPGLAERESAAQSAIQLNLAEVTADPYAAALATGTALLQIGVEAGADVSQVAEILNKAWGLDHGFSPGTVVGLAGTRDYASLYAQDRNTDARRLASWQNRSSIRSGQLNMKTTDWGEHLHCDFRRVRVAAESLFATSVTMETRAGGVRPVGKMTYHVPSTSLLCADPTYLFFTESDASKFAKQRQPPAAVEILAAADSVGILRTLWPATEPEIASTWAATFGSAGGLTRTPVAFVPRNLSAAPLFAASTSALTRRTASFATGLGATVMTTLSARMASIAENVVDVQTIGWLARFAAVVEIMRLSTSSETRAKIAVTAWPSLAGEVPRDLERSTSNHHMEELRRCLPATIRSRLPRRSAKTPVYAMLLEIGNPATAASHTVLRGLRRAFARAAEVATSVSIRERVGWRVGNEAAWLGTRLAVLREFWAVQFAALSQVAYCARELRQDLVWWVEVAAAVNLFRAGVMRGYAVAGPDEAVAAYADGVPLRLKPYHAAAHLRKSLMSHFPVLLPPFSASDRISEWVKVFASFTADYVADQMKRLPRVAKAGAVADHTSHFVRGAGLLADEESLSRWMEETTMLVVQDCQALLATKRAAEQPVIAAHGAGNSARMAEALMVTVDAMETTFARLATEVPPSEHYDAVEDAVADDAWDDFLEAVWDETHPHHAAAARQLSAAKAAQNATVAASIARWIMATFSDDVADSGAALV